MVEMGHSAVCNLSVDSGGKLQNTAFLTGDRQLMAKQPPVVHRCESPGGKRDTTGRLHFASDPALQLTVSCIQRAVVIRQTAGIQPQVLPINTNSEFGNIGAVHQLRHLMNTGLMVQAADKGSPRLIELLRLEGRPDAQKAVALCENGFCLSVIIRIPFRFVKTESFFLLLCFVIDHRFPFPYMTGLPVPADRYKPVISFCT